MIFTYLHGINDGDLKVCRNVSRREHEWRLSFSTSQWLDSGDMRVAPDIKIVVFLSIKDKRLSKCLNLF